MLYQLKRTGISQSDLVTVYKRVVINVLEYVYLVLHTHLQNNLSENIKIIQNRTLKCIFIEKAMHIHSMI